MCANCKPVGIKLDGDKMITVYSAAPVEDEHGFVGYPQRYDRGPDSFEDWWNDQDYTRTKMEQS